MISKQRSRMTTTGERWTWCDCFSFDPQGSSPVQGPSAAQCPPTGYRRGSDDDVSLSAKLTNGCNHCHAAPWCFPHPRSFDNQNSLSDRAGTAGTDGSWRHRKTIGVVELRIKFFSQSGRIRACEGLKWSPPSVLSPKSAKTWLSSLMRSSFSSSINSVARSARVCNCDKLASNACVSGVSRSSACESSLLAGSASLCAARAGNVCTSAAVCQRCAAALGG